MADRFTRIHTLQENLYTPGAPVLIAAGALLKDNQTGKILAQVKFQNISAKEIKAATVKLIAFDTAGRKLETEMEQQYLDLKVARDSYFGANSPIIIADTAARSYEVAVTEVIFANNTIWSGTDTPWQKPITLTPLSEALTDPELITQYAINLEKEIGLLKCLPQEQEDLWICPCGAINRQEEAACHSCKSELSTLKATLDINKLAADKNARLEAARQKAEAEAKEKAEKLAAAKEKAAKAAKKTTKYGIYAAIAAVIVWIGVLGFQALERSNDYKTAVAALESKDYETAIDGFNSLGDYKDSKERIKEVRYQRGKDLLEQKDYEGACTDFEYSSYKDSNKLLKESRYQLANEKMTKKDYPGALELFYKVKDYKDSDAKIAELKHLTNVKLKEFFDASDLTNAKSYIDKLKVRDDWGMLNKYYQGRVSESQSITTAYGYYNNIPDDFFDAANRKATMAKYKDYEGEYSDGAYDNFKVEIFIKNGEVYARHTNNRYGKIESELKKSDKPGYDYFWQDYYAGSERKYYVANNNTFDCYLFERSVNKWYLTRGFLKK